MTITHVALSGPAAANTGAVLNLNWTPPAANNTAMLYVLALAGQVIPTPPDWIPDLPPTTIGAFVGASFYRVTDSSEPTVVSVLTATQPSIAWIREVHGDVVPPTPVSAMGGDTSDGTDGVTTLSGTALPTVVGDWILSNTVWASSNPTFPTAPVAASSRTLTQSGATLSAIQNRAGTTWLTNHRYNISDAAVTAGAGTAPQYTSNPGVASLRGVTIFTVMHEHTVVPQVVSPPTVVDDLQTPVPTLLSVVDLVAPTPSDQITPVGPTVTAQSIVAVPAVSDPITAIAPATAIDATQPVGTSFTFLYDVLGTPLVHVDLSLFWDVEASDRDPDHPPITPGASDDIPTPANEGLEYELPQPISLVDLQESLETPTMIFYLAPDTIPPGEEVDLTIVTDEPLTPPGVPKVWTEIPVGTDAGLPGELAPAPSGPSEPPSNPEI